MEIIGFVGAIVIGLVLGLIGGGGSILAVPIFVYLFQLDPVIATAYSLFVVGISSIFGAAQYYRQKLIEPKILMSFGLPSILTIFLTRRYLLPAIPQEIVSIHNFVLTKSVLLLLLFALLMLGSSYKMITGGKTDNLPGGEINYISLIVQGAVLGVVTGLVGAGGGFLIIPALILFAKLPMKSAVGTSLGIISVNSLMGFFSDVHFSEYNWKFISIFAALSIIGILMGLRLSKNIEGRKLKPAFGWFVLMMGLFIITKELIIK